MKNLAIFAIGTNTGERKRNLTNAISHLTPLLEDLQCSGIYESDAMLLPNSPPEWNTPFLNMAVSGYITLTADQLLARTQGIEITMGRDADHPTWSPRIIDIDIIAIGGEVLKSSQLTIPHIGTLERQFFLMPLAELHPSWQYPQKGDNYHKTASALSAEFTNNPFNTKRICSYDG